MFNFNGLWTIEFISTMNRFGAGVLVLNNGRLLGGDNGYYYSGSYVVEGNNVRANVDIIRFNKNIISVFGDVDQYSLTFAGQIKPDSVEAVASFGNTKIRITCKKKVDL
ncbi:MAG TPA: hypothetical protein ACFYD7_13740 [Candidatus Wujingus californicus]|uniref:hypothetical protein n=1 Tax=Candidatus Wujingus californicus TaxID=3367618 RepID=UPI00402A41C8